MCLLIGRTHVIQVGWKLQPQEDVFELFQSHVSFRGWWINPEGASVWFCLYWDLFVSSSASIMTLTGYSLFRNTGDPTERRRPPGTLHGSTSGSSAWVISTAEVNGSFIPKTVKCCSWNWEGGSWLSWWPSDLMNEGPQASSCRIIFIPQINAVSVFQFAEFVLVHVHVVTKATFHQHPRCCKAWD